MKKLLNLGRVILVLSLLVGLVVVFIWNVDRERDNAIADNISKLNSQVNLRAEQLQESVDGYKRNTLFLASVPPVQGLVRAAQNNGLDIQEDSTSDRWKRRLTQIFTGFMQSHPLVLQVRYVGVADNGRELVRVNRTPDGLQVVGESELQSKGHREYFQHTLRLKPGQLYVSEINLNREFGQLEEPYRPTLRVATPVWDHNNQPFGMMVLNIDASSLLTVMAEDVPSGKTLYLTNARGDFLLHPDSARRFAFEFDRPWRWSDEFSAGEVDSGQQTVFREGEGFFLVQKTIQLGSGDSEQNVLASMLFAKTTVNRDASLATGKLFAGMFAGMAVIGGFVLLYWLNLQQRRQLHRQQGRLAAIVTNSQDAVVSATLEGKVTDWNLAAERILGFQRDEVLDKDYLQLLVPEDKLDESRRTLEKIRQGKVVLPYDTVRLRKDGSLVDLSVSVTPVLEEGRGIVGVAAIMRDIGRQKAVERQIQKLNEELEQRVASQTAEITEIHRLQQAVLSQAGYAVIAADPKGVIVMFNPAAEKMLGYKAKDIIGKNTPAIFHLEKEIAERARTFSAELGEQIEPGFEVFICKSKKGLANVHEWTYVRADGSQFPVQLSVTCLYDDKGNITGYLGMASDISQQVAARAELQHMQEHLLKAVEVGELGVWNWDVASDSLEWNEQMYRIYQLPKSHVLNYKTWHQVLHEDDRQMAIESLTEALAGNGTFNPEFRIIRPSGEVRIVQASAAMEWNDRGEVVRVVGINRDVTVQRTYEQKLQAARLEADSANRAKSAFLANMSHEIRTPMNAVLGLLQLLGKSQLETRQLDYVKKAESAGRLLLSILNDILDFSRVEAGKLELDPQPCNLDTMLVEVGAIASADIGDKNLEILFDICADIPKRVVLDGLRLQQILINLAGNAVKFTQQGEVRLSLKIIERQDEQLQLEFRVKDTGIGIAKAQLPHIFDGFRQAENSTARRFGGSGLGLAISQRLVQQMGGQLHVESEAGKGSEFSFSLPCTLAEERDLHNLPKDLKVLVVDDNASAREVLCKMVASFGWRADSVSQGDQAISQMAKGGHSAPYDLLLMDWDMPGLDGWETCECIGAMYPPDKLPLIIMVTAHGNELTQQRGRTDNGMIHAHLHKPVTPSMLLDAVADAMGKTARLGTQITAGVPRLKGVSLLLVEDNPTNQQVATELLELEGAKIQVAGNGQHAVDILAARRDDIDLVLMDIQMPEMDGYTAAREIRQTLVMTDLPIVAMTANAMESDRLDALNAGMNDHIGKPFELDKLVTTIQRNLVQGSHQPESQPSPIINETIRLDSQSAIRRLGNSQQIYANAARNFLKEAPDLVAQLPLQRPTDSAIESADLIHSLKGMTAMLGANALAKICSQLETLLRKNLEGDYPALVTSLKQQLEQLYPLLAKWADSAQEQGASQHLEPAQLYDGLKTLETLLEGADIDALSAFESLRAELLILLPTTAKDLAQSMESMDFPAALAHCQDALDSLQKHSNKSAGNSLS
ncbi:hypothetical protein GCM10009092_40760 [Bowmanella denitrificans]|uniref:histidine kinase n=1 Tax=Bowmanella denitrificans TaxID=366582 RepID=A0ABN0XTC0_9ALTE